MLLVTIVVWIGPMPLVVVLFLRCCPLECQVDAVNCDASVTIQETLVGLGLGGKFQKAIRRGWHVGWMPHLLDAVFGKGRQDFGGPSGLQFSRHILVQAVQKESRDSWVFGQFQGEIIVALVFSRSFVLGIVVPKAGVGGIVGFALHGEFW